MLVAPLPTPSFVPAYHYVINRYMVFDANYAALMGVVYLAYYYVLEPTAAVSLDDVVLLLYARLTHVFCLPSCSIHLRCLSRC